MTKVLYVEDNDDNVFMLKMRLELLGDFEVRPDTLMQDRISGPRDEVLLQSQDQNCANRRY